MRSRLVIIAALILYAATRCYLFIQTETKAPTTGDAGHYYIIAQNLAANNSYADYPTVNDSATVKTNIDISSSPPPAATSRRFLPQSPPATASCQPTSSATWRPPLWPFVLSVWMELTAIPYWQMILKLTFEGLLLVFVYLMLQSIEATNMVSGVVLSLLAIEPHYLKYSVTFLSENLTAFLLVLLTGSFLYSVMAHSRRATWCVAVFGALAVMSHPVVLPFVLMMVGVAIFRMFRIRRVSLALCTSALFFLVLMAWPLRNQLMFHQGLFMTTSQGAVLSKSWNDDVLSKHTNTQGDLLDEGLNVSRYPDLQSDMGFNPIQNSATMTEATFRFLSETELIILFKMAIWKWYCGINPIPQTDKPGLIEAMGTVFRVVYLLGLTLGIYALLTKRLEPNSLPFWSAWMLIMVFVAIPLTSILLYTGLRFNSVYAPLNLIMTFFVLVGLWKSFTKNDFKTVILAT